MINHNSRSPKTRARNPRGRAGIRAKKILPTHHEAAFRAALALRIVNARVSAGLLQRELADLMRVSQGRINHFETGRSIPSAIAIPVLCRCLRIDPNFLMDFTPDTPRRRAARSRRQRVKSEGSPP